MTEAIERFRELVLADDALQERLRRVSRREEFVALVQESAAQRGLAVSREDVEVALRHGRRVWVERWL